MGKDGSPHSILYLENPYLRIGLSNFGAAIYSFEMMDADGKWKDIALSCDSPNQFLQNRNYYGASIGRVANRISNASYLSSSGPVILTANDGKNHNHGGYTGISYRYWEVRTSSGPDTVMFTLYSPSGEEGYPGNLTIHTEYRLKDNELSIAYRACSDQDTVLSLTNHIYWCLGGLGENIGNEILQISAGAYIEVDDYLIPTGRIVPVNGTPFDFRSPTRLEERLHAGEHHIQKQGGFDLCYALDRSTEPIPAARLTDEDTGIMLEIETTMKGIQLYTGNGLCDETGKHGIPFGKHSAVCLECGAFPDTVHHPEFGSIELPAGKEYHEEIIYRITKL